MIEFVRRVESGRVFRSQSLDFPPDQAVNLTTFLGLPGSFLTKPDHCSIQLLLRNTGTQGSTNALVDLYGVTKVNGQDFYTYLLTLFSGSVKQVDVPGVPVSVSLPAAGIFDRLELSFTMGNGPATREVRLDIVVLGLLDHGTWNTRVRSGES